VAEKITQANVKQALGLRVSWGTKMNIFGTRAVYDHFPDGCKVETELVGGRVVLLLSNRASGLKVYTSGNGNRPARIMDSRSIAELGVPKFGACDPERVELLDGNAVRMTMPAELPALREVSKEAKPHKSTAKVRAPLVKPAAATQPAPAAQMAPAEPASAAASTAPVPAAAAIAAAPQPEYQPESKPGADDEDRQFIIALNFINAVKARRGDAIVLELKADGGVKALMEVGG
jgi:hypothetical protein